MENDTRSKLIEIATELFATKGFAAVSIRELTVAAQVNVSAISYYFKGKGGLYRAVLKEQLAPVLQVLELAKDHDSLSPTERLSLYANRIMHIHLQRPFLSHFIHSEIHYPTGHGDSIIENHISQVHQFIETTLQEGVANGDFRVDLNITYSAISLAGIMNFYFISKPLYQKFIYFPENANSEYMNHAFQIYLRGIMN
ncbi:MAG: yttP 3 [Firmicutes bacterium]|nr:yttP 3 [Bacillota bacterium]